jgi:hypothetical protein
MKNQQIKTLCFALHNNYMNNNSTMMKKKKRKSIVVYTIIFFFHFQFVTKISYFLICFATKHPDKCNSFPLFDSWMNIRKDTKKKSTCYYYVHSLYNFFCIIFRMKAVDWIFFSSFSWLFLSFTFFAVLFKLIVKTLKSHKKIVWLLFKKHALLLLHFYFLYISLQRLYGFNEHGFCTFALTYGVFAPESRFGGAPNQRRVKGDWLVYMAHCCITSISYREERERERERRIKLIAFG